jgi:outer membrane protein TolC
MKKIFLPFLTFMLINSACLQAEEISLNLEEAVALALRDNRDILFKAEEVKKAKEKIKQAQADLLPSLAVSTAWQNMQEYYPETIGQTTLQAGVSQTLFAGGKIINTIAYNKYGMEISQAVLDKTKLETVLLVKKTLYTLLLANNLVGLNKNIVTNTEAHLAFLKERYKSGEASESDILKIESSLATVKEAYQSALSQVEASQELLNNLLYLGKDVRVRPAVEFSYDPKEVAYDSALLTALEKRPEIRQYAAQEKAAQKSVEIAKAGTRPTVTAAWDYYSTSHILGTKNWHDYNILGITLSWPIFDGFATKAKVDQAIVDVKEAQILKEQSIKNIALELKNAYLSLKDAISAVTAAESDIKFYQDNLASIKEKYIKGIASELDADDAKLKYEIAFFNRLQSVYDYIIAKNEFEKASGGI